MTVAIGFNHGKDFSIRSDFRSYLAQVPTQRGEIDETKGGPACGLVRHLVFAFRAIRNLAGQLQYTVEVANLKVHR
jgi:hypothetical protein